MPTTSTVLEEDVSGVRTGLNRCGKPDRRFGEALGQRLPSLVDVHSLGEHGGHDREALDGL